jgi:hypothetical protein
MTTNQVGYELDTGYNKLNLLKKVKSANLNDTFGKITEMAAVKKAGTPTENQFMRERLAAHMADDIIGQATSKELSRSRRTAEEHMRNMPKMLAEYLGQDEAAIAAKWNAMSPDKKAQFMYLIEDRISSGRQLRIQETAIKAVAGKGLDFEKNELLLVMLNDYTMDTTDSILDFPNS